MHQEKVQSGKCCLAVLEVANVRTMTESNINSGLGRGTQFNSLDASIINSEIILTLGQRLDNIVLSDILILFSLSCHRQKKGAVGVLIQSLWTAPRERQMFILLRRASCP